MAINCLNDNHLDNKWQTANFLSPTNTTQPPMSRQNPPFNGGYNKELSHKTNTLMVGICTKPTYKLCINSGGNAPYMHIAPCFLNTRTGINLSSSTSLPSQWTRRIKREKDALSLQSSPRTNLHRRSSRSNSTSISVSFALEYKTSLYIVLPSICNWAHLLSIPLSAESSHLNEMSTQPRNAISLVTREHQMLQHHLANRLTMTNPTHTQFVFFEKQCPNCAANIAS